MRRTVLLLAGVLLSVVALGADSPKEYDDKTEVAGIEGAWRLIEFEYNGKREKPPVHWVDTYRNGIKTRNVSGGDTWRGNYRIDPTQKPSHLDDYSRGITIKSNYHIDGDTLRIATLSLAYVGKDGRRPQGFNDESVLVEIYKRVK